MLIGLLHIFLELLFVVCAHTHVHIHTDSHALTAESVCCCFTYEVPWERVFLNSQFLEKLYCPNLLCIFLILRLLLCHCFLVGIIWDGWRLRKGLWTYLWGGFLMTHQLGPVMRISRWTWESMFGSLVKFSNGMKTILRRVRGGQGRVDVRAGC